MQSRWRELCLVSLLGVATNAVGAAPGDFDSSFNGLGFTRELGDIAFLDFLGGVGIHSTGEIVAAGSYRDSRTGPDHLVLWRHLPDGRLDGAFGGTGFAYPPSPPELNVGPASLAIDNQNRIVMVTIPVTYVPGTHVVYRFNFDGSPDLSFSGTGHTVVPIGTGLFGITGVAIQPDNKIVAVDGAINPASNRMEFAVYRLLENGGLDPSFGDGGRVFTQITVGIGDDRATGVAIQADGKIVVAGRASSSPADVNFALARYSPTGVLDADFGTGGKVVFSILDFNQGRKLVIQPDGKIVIAGRVCEFIGGGDMNCYAGVARVDERGLLDPSFGGTGKVFTDVGAGGAGVFDVALQPDNKILVAGEHQWKPDRSAENAIVIRHQPDGSLDRTFGLNGISEMTYGYIRQEADFIRVQSDGQIVVGGFTDRGVDGPGSAVTARYLSTGVSAPVSDFSANESIARQAM